MKLIIVIQLVILSIFLTAITLYLYECSKYIKIKKFYNEDYLKAYKINKMRKYYFLVPKCGSSKYVRTQKLISDSGWSITVEGFYAYKWVLFIIGFTLITCMQTTNSLYKSKLIIQDVNYNKMVIDSFNSESRTNIELERIIFNYVEEKVLRSNEIYDNKNDQMNIEYIENLILQKGIQIKEDVKIVARRTLEKIKAVRIIYSDLGVYILGFLLAILLYMLPNVLSSLSKALIENKREWEVLNFLFAFSIFGRLPPYSIKSVLDSMEMVAEVYKPLIMQLTEGVKKGGGQKSFKEILVKTKNDDLYELFETMMLASDTGLLNAVDDIDEMVEQKLKWIEISDIKRRKSKKLYALVFVSILILLAGIYFSYGLTVLSNPANLIPK